MSRCWTARSRGRRGEVKLYVNSVGRVIDTVGETEPKAGSDVYLTIDADLQKAAYNVPGTGNWRAFC